MPHNVATKPPTNDPPTSWAPPSSHFTALEPRSEKELVQLNTPCFPFSSRLPGLGRAGGCRHRAGRGERHPGPPSPLSAALILKHHPLWPHHLREGTAAWSWGRNHLKISLRILKLPGWKPVTAASHFSNLAEDPVLPGVYFESVLQGRARVSQVRWP